MKRHIEPQYDSGTSRRDFLWRLGGGLGGIALASMLGDEGLLASDGLVQQRNTIQYPPKAKRVVQL